MKLRIRDTLLITMLTLSVLPMVVFFFVSLHVLTNDTEDIIEEK